MFLHQSPENSSVNHIISSREIQLKNVMPAEELPHNSSEDDLLGPGDGNSKIGQKIGLKNTKSKVKKIEGKVVETDASISPANNSPIDMSQLLAQLHKKDDQIDRLTESVACMALEIQKLNNIIIKMQEAKSQENTSCTSKGVHNIPFSKVLQPEEKKNGSLSEVTPLAKVPSVPAKKAVKFADVVKRDLVKAQSSIDKEEVVKEIQASCWKGKDLSYLISLESGVEKWINSKDCESIQGMVKEFHKLHPGAPNQDDYSLSDSLKSEFKKKRTILSKIKKNQSSNYHL